MSDLPLYSPHGLTLWGGLETMSAVTALDPESGRGADVLWDTMDALTLDGSRLLVDRNGNPWLADDCVNTLPMAPKDGADPLPPLKLPSYGDLLSAWWQREGRAAQRPHLAPAAPAPRPEGASIPWDDIGKAVSVAWRWVEDCWDETEEDPVVKADVDAERAALARLDEWLGANTIPPPAPEAAPEEPGPGWRYFRLEHRQTLVSPAYALVRVWAETDAKAGALLDDALTRAEKNAGLFCSCAAFLNADGLRDGERIETCDEVHVFDLTADGMANIPWEPGIQVCDAEAIESGGIDVEQLFRHGMED